MSAYIQQARVLSGRQLTLMGVIGLHALVITALIAIKYVPPMIDPGPAPFEIINDPPEVIPPPAQPTIKPVEMQRFQIVVPVIQPPDVTEPLEAQVIETPVAASGPVQIDSGPEPASENVVPAPPARVFTDLRYSIVRSTDEYYPNASVTLLEQGIAIVRVCVDGAGRISGQPTIQTSSGYKRLDQAAIKWVKEALRFTPAMENGVGVQACKGFRVVFNLN
jgi:TonB family protein